ncbi:hypothetical protein C4D60_Mb00t03060 [Musa balbisiana]|uniref:Uncharacterized protein n=1 Tax=Musa balbisiana TaxID=52838 RepID=A0A4S8I620_MUSBA|nr:hypothetical protein C4D60_Mb00t03060 [Musa balbisiana]
MPRSRINANFIDKTSSIVANILLRIIPTTSGEKKAFTYYRDVVLSITRKKRDVRDRKNQIFEINSRLVKVKFGDRTIPSVVYPRLMQPQMLQLSILVLSERMNDRNGCWLNPKEIMRKLYRIIMKLRDQKLIPMIEVIYSIT